MAGTWAAIVNVSLTVCPSVASNTRACEGVDTILVLMWRGGGVCGVRGGVCGVRGGVCGVHVDREGHRQNAHPVV